MVWLPSAVYISQLTKHDVGHLVILLCHSTSWELHIQYCCQMHVSFPALVVTRKLLLNHVICAVRAKLSCKWLGLYFHQTTALLDCISQCVLSDVPCNIQWQISEECIIKQVGCVQWNMPLRVCKINCAKSIYSYLLRQCHRLLNPSQINNDRLYYIMYVIFINLRGYSPYSYHTIFTILMHQLFLFWDYVYGLMTGLLAFICLIVISQIYFIIM